MATTQDLMAFGMVDQLASRLGFGQGTALTATGSTRADAYAIIHSISVFTTVGSGTGAVLPATTTAGQPVAQAFKYIKNDDASGSDALTLYAAGSDTISGTAGATGVSIPAGEGYLVIMLDAGGGWIGFPLGT